MKYVYANLIGTWQCLNDDPDCKIGDNLASPYIWWEENAEIYSPKTKEAENSFYSLDYVNICYKGVDYRIHPIHIQIVTK